MIEKSALTIPGFITYFEIIVHQIIVNYTKGQRKTDCRNF